MRSYEDLQKQNIDDMITYFETINFDYTYQINDNMQKYAYIGITHHLDNSFSEIIAISINPSRYTKFVNAFPTLLYELAQFGIDILSITLERVSLYVELFKKLDFRQLSGDIYLMREIIE